MYVRKHEQDDWKALEKKLRNGFALVEQVVLSEDLFFFRTRPRKRSDGNSICEQA